MSVRMVMTVVGAMVLLTLHGCGRAAPDCSDETKFEVKSPSGHYIATWYERDCGATTNFANIVRLRDSTDRLDPQDHSGDVFVSSGQPRLALEWVNEDTLHIRCVECGNAKILERRDNWREVKVEY